MAQLLDQYGRPLVTEKPRTDVAALQQRYATLKARYDAAQTTDEFKNYWANADRYDADSANSKDVRHILISRSRYEIGNNGYADGIASTYATDLIGVGPTLRMQSGSEGFNRMVELSWFLWSKAVHFRRKLWCMAHAKGGDGEGIGVVRRNPRLSHPIPLDICLYEAEQVQTPYLPFKDGFVDGIEFDEFGNPTYYDLLRYHPGTTHGVSLDPEPEHIPAAFVLHWFKLRRPGQHRGVPENASTLNTGAASRRWREDVLAAADRVALQTLMMETPMTPDEADAIAPFSTMDLEKGLMTFLPMGWKPNQLQAVFPTVGHSEFNKQLINEQARPKSMPYNKAACDSSSYNYASGRLDHQTYYAALDVEREDCNDLVLDPLFNLWFDAAIMRFGWLGGNPEAIGPGARIHIWDWPKHRVADVESEANANQTKLKSGQIFPHRLASDSGWDWEDECEEGAKSLGVSVEEFKTRILNVLYPTVQQGGSGSSNPQVEEVVASLFKQLERRRDGLAVKVNGNGGHHAN